MAACYAPLAAKPVWLPLGGLAVGAPGCKPELGARLLGGSRQQNRRCHKLDFLSKLGGSKGLAFSLPFSVSRQGNWTPKGLDG
jgi:hypothetical protein